MIKFFKLQLNIRWLLKRWWLFFLLIGLLALFGFVYWALTPFGPMPEAILALRSDSEVMVSTSPWLSFTPVDQSITTGLILYPGGRVDPRSYAPAARDIASQGYLVIIVPMPLNLAVFGADTASQIIATYPEVRNWTIGGHSLGGVMAARFATENPDKIQALLLWAAYPSQADDLSANSLFASSIYATLDGLTTIEDIQRSQELLPEAAQYIQIDGGNHAQFGWYGPQPGDKPATISRDEQQTQVVAASLELLANFPTE